MYDKNHFLAQIRGGQLSVIEIDRNYALPSIQDYNYRLSNFLYCHHIIDNLYLFYCCLSDCVYLASRLTVECILGKTFHKLPIRYMKELLETNAIMPIGEDEGDMIVKYYQRYNMTNQKNLDHFAFCPTLNCNCRCVYCYEKHIDKSIRSSASMDHLKGFCKFVEDFIDSNPNRIITCELFGGEPLMKENRTLNESYFEWLASKNLTTAITTNGSDFFDYIDLLLARKKQIYVVNLTVDGPESIHNIRRPSRRNQNEFENIERVIDILIGEHIPVSISINLDAENVDCLEETIDYVLKKGWPEKFSFYICKVDDHLNNIGRNACLNEGQLLYRVLPILKRTPKHLLHLIRLTFLRLLSAVAHEFGLVFRQNGKGRARFRHCFATSPVNTYYFCPDNSVYRCPSALGITDLAIGTFDAKQTNIKNKTLKEWRERAFFKVDKCKQCSIAPLCGGGCLIDIYSGRQDKSCAEYFESLNIFCREILPAWLLENPFQVLQKYYKGNSNK